MLAREIKSPKYFGKKFCKRKFTKKNLSIRTPKTAAYLFISNNKWIDNQ